MAQTKRKPTLQELAAEGVFKEQAGRFASRLPLSFQTVVNDVLAAIPDNPDVAAAHLEELVYWAERGRAWHPAMGTMWDTAEQAAQR